MKTAQAQEVADQLLSEVGRKGHGEPSGKTVSLAVGGMLVNLARIADALEDRNNAMRRGSWDG